MEKKVVGLGKTIGTCPGSAPWPLMVTRVVSKVGVGTLPGVVVEVLQLEVEVGKS
jgi:hypothetical protein